MNPHSDVIARSPDDQSGRRGNLRDGRDCFVSLAMTVGLVAQETLPVLLVLYPLLLLLDDLEPGFVRSVVNPHWFLVALIIVGIVAGHGGLSPSTAAEGERGKVGSVMIPCVAASIIGAWTWWRLHAGTLGIVVGLLTAIAVFAMVSMFGDKEISL